MGDPALPRWRRPVAGAALVLAVAVAASAGLAVVGPAGGAPVAGAQAPDDDRPQLPGGPPADPDGTRDRADEILARSEYRGPQTPEDTIVDRIRRWIGDRLPDVDGSGLSRAGDPVAFLIVGLVVLGAAGAVIWTLVGARRTRRPDEDVDTEIDVTPLRSPDEWADEAERCARAGDHRGAVRAHFRSLTTTLARRGLVADTPGRTAGEQRADVAARAPALTPAFGAVADLFEQVWFGARATGAGDVETARDLAARARAAAPRRADTDGDADADALGGRAG